MRTKIYEERPEVIFRGSLPAISATCKGGSCHVNSFHLHAQHLNPTQMKDVEPAAFFAYIITNIGAKTLNSYRQG